MAWVDLGDRTNVSTIKLHCDNASAISYWGAIEVDGSMLIDNTHDNSFHLKFDDATDLTTLGENSLETIDYSSVNASKGAPILKTNKVGSAVTSGYRTDTHAGTTNDTGLVLAIPGNSVASGTCDVHQQINTGSSNKAVTLIGDPTLDTKKFWNSSKFYGKSIAFNGDDGLSFAGDAAFDWGTYTSGTAGDFTLEARVAMNPTLGESDPNWQPPEIGHVYSLEIVHCDPDGGSYGGHFILYGTGDIDNTWLKAILVGPNSTTQREKE